MSNLLGPNSGRLVDALQGELHYVELMKQWRALDAAFGGLRVINITQNAPTGSEVDGDAYVVGPAPTGAFAPHAGEYARRSSAAQLSAATWEFFPLKHGWRIYDRGGSKLYIVNASLALVDALTPALGALQYQGGWNANTNSPAIPAASSANKGYYYVVTTASGGDVSHTNCPANTNYLVGDWLVSNGTTWDYVGGREAETLNTPGAIPLRDADGGFLMGPLKATASATSPGVSGSSNQAAQPGAVGGNSAPRGVGVYGESTGGSAGTGVQGVVAASGGGIGVHGLAGSGTSADGVKGEVTGTGSGNGVVGSVGASGKSALKGNNNSATYPTVDASNANANGDVAKHSTSATAGSGSAVVAEIQANSGTHTGHAIIARKYGATVTGRALNIDDNGTDRGGINFNGEAGFGDTPTSGYDITAKLGKFLSKIADGAAAVGFDLVTQALSTAGALALRIKNNTTVLFTLDKDGNGVLTGGLTLGTPLATSSGGSPWPSFRRHGWWNWTGISATRVAVGLATPDTFSFSAMSDETEGVFGKFDNSISSSVGRWGSAAFDETKTRNKPIMRARIKTGPNATDIQNCRIRVGLYSATPYGSGAMTSALAAFRYLPALDGTVFWRTETADGTTANVVASATAIAHATVYELTLDASDPTSIKFYINGTLVATHTTNLPAQTTALGGYVAIEATSSSQVMLVDFFHLEQR